jgi:hypothetical protein
VKERHWNSLVAALRHGDCVLMLGSEIPISSFSDSHLSDGESFVDALQHELSRELKDDARVVHGNTLAAVAQQYEDSEGFGANSLRATAEKFYRSNNFRPSKVHETLASLPFPLILTTCQDACLARALKVAGKDPMLHRYHLRGDKRDNPEFSLPSSPHSPLIFHLFGDVEEPSSLVLSENDILDFMIAVVSERPPLPNSLLRALKRPGQSFLFVGFGIKHWDLRVLLKVLLRGLQLNRGGTTVAAESLRGLLQTDREETILFYQRGTRVEVEDADAEPFLAELARRLEAEGGFSGTEKAHGPRPRVFVSYAREDQDLAAKVFGALQSAQFEPWLDRESLEGGEHWDERIQSELAATDFTLLLYTPAFCKKSDSYVNKEVALARRRALEVRGPFLIPLRTASIADAERVDELREYNEMSLNPTQFEDDMSKVLSTMLREYQRRNR